MVHEKKKDQNKLVIQNKDKDPKQVIKTKQGQDRYKKTKLENYIHTVQYTVHNCKRTRKLF